MWYVIDAATPRRDKRDRGRPRSPSRTWRPAPTTCKAPSGFKPTSPGPNTRPACTRDTDLAVEYARLRGRRRAAESALAVADSILVAAFHMTKTCGRPGAGALLGDVHHDDAEAAPARRGLEAGAGRPSLRAALAKRTTGILRSLEPNQSSGSRDLSRWEAIPSATTREGAAWAPSLSGFAAGHGSAVMRLARYFLPGGDAVVHLPLWLRTVTESAVCRMTSGWVELVSRKLRVAV